MSRPNQIKFNAQCVVRQISAGHWTRAQFHLKGLIRAFLPSNFVLA
jgi:hypothetical protein